MSRSNNTTEEGNADFRATASSSPAENQLVLYTEEEAEGEPTLPQSQTPSVKPQCPSIGAFTVQCASCFKWRLMPSMHKYEEIREQLLQNPFFCETASEWNPGMSCDVPADIYQDGTRLWAIDKPSIARPPPGWKRLLRIRGEGGTRFADVYYVSPSGKKLRSTVEVQKYLNDHPKYICDGVKLSQFSFQIPKPLQHDYVKKRPARSTESNNNTNTPVATEANPLAWISPDDRLKKTRISEPPTSGSNHDVAE